MNVKPDQFPNSATGNRTTQPALTVRAVRKAFGQYEALSDIDLSIEEGEFVTLLGSSGSGKTTLLRIIAGLTEPTAGTISIRGSDVTHLPIEKRDIGFVFQNYALFPHLCVRENIGFGLKLRKYSGAELKARTEEMMDLVHLSALGERYPSQLSGGQQQRVAIARALAPAPKLLLLDEPLGALDRRLRQQLGEELKRIQRDTDVTAIYVTHDQEEAFLLSDRIAVMETGRIRQVDTPRAIYRNPASLFVANFVGETCQMQGVVRNRSGNTASVEIGGIAIQARMTEPAPDGTPVTVVLRPEQVRILERNAASIAPGRNRSALLRGTIRSCIFLGNRLRLKIDAAGFELDAELDGGHNRQPAEGDTVEVTWEAGAPLAYPAI
jgi:ABC-type Fe3+/spermidine/putrescine transport system ATPase subunit